MLSVNNPPLYSPLYLRRFLAIVICCLSLAFIKAGWSLFVSADSNAAAAFAAAAEQNANLKFDLIWTFSARPQRGWYLYVPLIQRLIDTDSAPETKAFAQALADWQRSVGLASTGVLSQETWMKMVAVFQSRRIKDRSTLPTERLTLAPASEFFDPERPESLRGVERQAYEAYKELVAAAATDLSLSSNENWLKIISAFRSPAYQAQLRKQNPRSGRGSLAVNSPHFTGRALDLYVGGEPVSTDDRNRAIQVNTKVYQWLVKNAERYGFYPYFYEPWHWEYNPQLSAE
ncbi:MAG TPA: M15 family metallopeptidase [Blastocatellia bacterium]|nr:M15 family metallopeptidase [Blastocatellia bacterium]